MVYNKQLPHVRDFLRLSRYYRPFPASRDEVVEAAEMAHMDQEMISFLMLFPASAFFKSRVDFLTRCEELEMLINQEREAPKEILHSQQD